MFTTEEIDVLKAVGVASSISKVLSRILRGQVHLEAVEPIDIDHAIHLLREYLAIIRPVQVPIPSAPKHPQA